MEPELTALAKEPGTGSELRAYVYRERGRTRGYLVRNGRTERLRGVPEGVTVLVRALNWRQAQRITRFVKLVAKHSAWRVLQADQAYWDFFNITIEERRFDAARLGRELEKWT